MSASLCRAHTGEATRSAPLLRALPRLLLMGLLLLGGGALAAAQDEVRVSFSAEPAQAAPGELVELRADVVIKAGHYAYAKGEPNGVVFSAKLPAGLIAEGEFTQPAPTVKAIPYMGPNGTSLDMGTHKGTLRFVQKVRVAASASGALEVPVSFTYQVCNEQVCLMPTTSEGQVAVHVGEAPAAPAASGEEPPAGEPSAEDEPSPSFGGEFGGLPGGEFGVPLEGESGSPRATASIHPAKAPPGEIVELRIDFKVGEHWHVYALESPNAQPLALELELPPGFEALGKPTQPAPKAETDEYLGPVTSHYGDFRVTQLLRVTGEPGPRALKGRVTWQACDPNQCLPGELSINETLTLDPQAPPTGIDAASVAPADPAPAKAPEPEAMSLTALLKLALAAFGMGLAMLAMPCTYPMIPITVSVFSKGSQLTRGQTALRAGAYGLGIVISFVVVGGLVQVAVGGEGQAAISAFATNPWVNLLLGAVFIYFAFSFFGYYELGLPAPLQNLMQAGAAKTGSDGTVPVWSLFLMGLFFVLTSYTCGAPVVLSLFVTAAGTAGAGTVVFATTVFAVTVALPFVVLALVPNAMRFMPKSGSWFSVFKVLLGLVELGFAVKFFRGVDIQWDWLSILPREAVLAIWTLLSLTAAVYLIGRLPLRFPHDPPLRPVSKQRAAWALGFFALAAFFVSGYFRSLPSDVEAFIMPEHSGPVATFGTLDYKTDLESLERAKRKAGPEGRLFLMFTGHVCVNCAKMEHEVLPKPEIEALLGPVERIALFTDKGETEGQHRNLMVKTFNPSGAIPAFYVVDGEGKVRSKQIGYAAPEEFAEFLRAGGLK